MELALAQGDMPGCPLMQTIRTIGGVTEVMPDNLGQLAHRP